MNRKNLSVAEKIAQARARIEKLEKLEKLESILNSPIGERIFSAILEGVAEGRERMISTESMVLIARTRKGFSDGGTLRKVYVENGGAYVEAWHYFKAPSGTPEQYAAAWGRLSLDERLSLYTSAVELGKFLPVEPDKATARKPADNAGKDK